MKIHQTTYVTFGTINHFSQLLCIFLAQPLHTFNKSSPSKWKFWDFLLLRLKFTKFLMSFFKWKVSFSSNFASLFGAMRDKSFLPFHLNLCMLCTNGFSQSANFQTFDSSHENLMSFFKPQISFPFNFATPFMVMTHNSSEMF